MPTVVTRASSYEEVLATWDIFSVSDSLGVSSIDATGLSSCGVNYCDRASEGDNAVSGTRCLIGEVIDSGK